MAELNISETKVHSDELQKWHKSNPVEELFYAQKEIARFLELGYLALRDHPKVAAEIRNTAHKSRTQHVLTVGLFKKFVVTASSVVNTYCPMMMDALELQDIEILKEAFGQVLEMCVDMKKETEDSRNSYIAIQQIVQNNISTVNETNEGIETEIKDIEQKKKQEQAQLKVANKTLEELEKEKEELKEKVETIINNRDILLKKSEDVGTFIDVAMIPTMAMIAGPYGAVVGAVTFGANIFRKHKKAERSLKASQEANKHAKTTYDEKRNVTKTLYERKQETLHMIANIEALDLRKSSFGDIESLKEAITQLGNVDNQFMKIIIFWDSMATMLKHLYQDQTAARVYLKKIEDDKYAEDFLNSINKAEKTWNRIGLVCQKYVHDNDEVILKVYGFLSAPVDNMSDEEVQKRKKSLIREMKDEAEQLDDVE